MNGSAGALYIAKDITTMAKYRFFQVIMALSLVILIISSAIMLAFEARKVSEKSYRPNKDGEISSVMNNGGSEKLTDFEAWVEYSIVSDGLDGDSEDGYRDGSIYLSTENVMRLEQLRSVKVKASNGMFISLVVLVVCFVVVQRRRLYECVVWGGAAGVITGLICFLMVALSGSGMAYGIRRMVFGGSYAELFPGHDVLSDIIPDGLGLKVLCVYMGTLFAGLVLTIVVRLISYKKSRPHSFR